MAGKGKPFGKGNKASQGIPKPNAGRPPDWLKDKCREAGPKVVEFLIDVATGQNMEQVVNDNGETIGVPAAVKDRIKAAEVVLDRGYGKPDQKMDMNLNDVTKRPSREDLEAALELVRGGAAS